MHSDLIGPVFATWAAKKLPARLGAEATAELLGFREHDIQILMRTGKLEPLGDPAPNAPKLFSAVEIIALAADRDWLGKATKDISKHWRGKRDQPPTPRSTCRKGRGPSPPIVTVVSDAPKIV